MKRYAAHTTVPVERSRAELEHVLERYGCDQTFYGKDADQFMVGFRYQGIPCRIVMPRSKAKSETVAGRQDRQAMRILLLLIKAKLEAVEAGIQRFDVEFAGSLLLKNGSTVGEWIRPQIAKGAIPESLPMLTEGEKS